MSVAMDGALVTRLRMLADLAGGAAQIGLGTPGSKMEMSGMEMDTGAAWESRYAEYQANGQVLSVIVDKINEIIAALEAAAVFAPELVLPLTENSFCEALPESQTLSLTAANRCSSCGGVPVITVSNWTGWIKGSIPTLIIECSCGNSEEGQDVCELLTAWNASNPA